ncbi:MAG TPA: DUF349 domain-containing protein [Salinivirgaceae bacterium]|nr:DUF349 domain-containing protein [Salinivirgaceae bacterium]
MENMNMNQNEAFGNVHSQAPESVENSGELIAKEDTSKAPTSQDEPKPQTQVDVDKESLEVINQILSESDEDDDEQDQDTEDVSVLSRSELVAKLETILHNRPVQKLGRLVDDIINRYNELREEEIARERKEAEKDGHDEDFVPSEDPLADKLRKLAELYRQKIREYKDNLEKEKEENLRKKQDIIKAIESLINKEESLNKTFSEFHQLQDEWRKIGVVPQKDSKHLYEMYNHVVERFYDYVKINKELRELDLKKNLEQKIELCEKAEALILEPSVTKAFKALQEYHKLWREIGPVPRDKKEEVWERFKNATAQINQKHHEYYSNLREDQENNLEQKRALIAKIQEINRLTLIKPKKWEEKAKEIIEIQKLWKNIGFAPRKENNELFVLFKAECDKFFEAKRAYFEERRKEEQNNLQLKIDLCVQAEALKDSTDWKKTTEEYIKLQKRWKEIGSVPRKYSETIWQRFRAACDAFFEAKSQHFGNLEKQQAENLNKKLEIIQKLKNFEYSGNNEEDLKNLNALQKEWTEIGFVPFDKKDEILKEYREAIKIIFDRLKVSVTDYSFKSKLQNWKENPKNKGKLNQERNKIINKIRELENENALYTNNIGFFSNSTNAQNLIRDIEKKIERNKAIIEDLKEKLQIIDNADTEE